MSYQIYKAKGRFGDEAPKLSGSNDLWFLSLSLNEPQFEKDPLTQALENL